jgi:hypothetical protein
MKDPNFKEYAKGTANGTAVIPGAKIRLVRRSIPGGVLTFTIAAGNCIWSNGTEEEMEKKFAELTA